MKPQVPVSLKFSSPLDGYRTLVRDGALTHDPAQELAAEKLEILHARLKTYEPGKSGGWRSLFRRDIHLEMRVQFVQVAHRDARCFPHSLQQGRVHTRTLKTGMGKKYEYFLHGICSERV